MAGLTTTGITIKSVDEILSDIESEQLANIDPALNTEADSVLGQLNGIIAAAFARLWELIEEVYQSAYPDTASGQSLSYIAALTGAIRQEATKAELAINLIGTVGTLVPAGTRFYVDTDADSLFETTVDATILEQGAIDFVTTTARAVTVGSSTSAVPGDTLVIATPVSGLTSITTFGANPLTAGVDEETDAELRQRREQSLALAGSSTVEAIRADMLTVTGVDTCTVFENPTAQTDDNDVPPYAIEVLVSSTAAPSYTAQDVVDQIWASKPAGTQTYGGLSGTVTDSQGDSHTIYYSEPTTTLLYARVDLTAATDGTYTSDDLVKSAIAQWVQANVEVGQSIYASDLVNVVADIKGVISVDVTNTFIEDSSPPTATDWTATARQLGTLAVGNIVINS